ncbi:hypothetical protein H9X57_03430 [Flavobacterium piscinae]|uniref:hypothetical protein n=1 Tax=Flavobacterium piscinae TaxID=2506424 RepID=UPI001989FA56|nr:hypothetical protein [Flavobacterium piscinae]MBC8882776.1 hypothetical protein [Flavobacterium piscinae]
MGDGRWETGVWSLEMAVFIPRLRERFSVVEVIKKINPFSSAFCEVNPFYPRSKIKFN